jgi:hypothetical protein
MGGLGELPAVGRSGHIGAGERGSPELEKMAAGELARAGEDGGGRGRLPRALGFAVALARARSSACGGAVVGGGGKGVRVHEL